MPELPEVDAVRRALQPVMEGARFIDVVLRRPRLRTDFPLDFAARLCGQTVQALQRRGKYLLASLSSNETLVMHLGMSGSFRVETASTRILPGEFYITRDADARHDHVVFEMSSGALVTFNDPRRFGFMNLVSESALRLRPLLSHLGPEPLSREFTAAVLARACAGKRMSLKLALSDQRVVAGLGNIYVCEALHRARLSPRRRAATIATSTGKPRPTAVLLTAAVKRVLTDAIARSMRPYDASHRSTQPRTVRVVGARRFRVYDQSGARCVTRGCPGIIRRITQAGRSTWFCPVCQR